MARVDSLQARIDLTASQQLEYEEVVKIREEAHFHDLLSGTGPSGPPA